MFKGSLLPKGGYLTRRFAEDMLILLCCPTGGPTGGLAPLELFHLRRACIRIQPLTPPPPTELACHRVSPPPTPS
jgi:hypothetical protein